MLRRSIFLSFKSYPKAPLFSIKNFCSQQTPKSSSEKETQKKSETKFVITPKMIGIGLVCLSWVFLIKLWKDAEGATVHRANEYYEKGIKMDVAPPEEYRKEYVKCFIRSYVNNFLG